MTPHESSTRPITVLFYGRAGSGKGTQVALLREYLEKNTSAQPLVVETGAAFRQFMDGKSHTSHLTKELMEQGKLPEVFIPIWLWTGALIQNYTGTEHLLFDGFPRRPIEADVLDSALAFYSRTNVFIVVLNISRDHAAQRLELRKRADDHEAQIHRRHAWYETDVVPTIEHFRQKGTPYTVIELDGERPVEVIHEEILTKLGLK